MKKISTEVQDDWSNLIRELQYIEESISVLNERTIALNNVYNTMLITMGSLIKILAKNNILDEKELDKEAVKMLRNMKKTQVKESKKLVQDNKKLMYDKLLQSDIGANA